MEFRISIDRPVLLLKVLLLVVDTSRFNVSLGSLS